MSTTKHQSKPVYFWLNLPYIWAETEIARQPNLRQRPFALVDDRRVVATWGWQPVPPAGGDERELASHVLRLPWRPKMGWFRHGAIRDYLNEQTPGIKEAGPGVFGISVPGQAARLKHVYGSVESFGRHLTERIKSDWQLTARVGIAGEALSARIASNTATDGQVFSLPKQKDISFLSKQPLFRLPDVPRYLLTRLWDRYRLRTVGALYELSAPELVQMLGPSGHVLYRYLHSSGIRLWGKGTQSKQTIWREQADLLTHLEGEANEPAWLRSRLFQLAERLGYKLRKQNLGAGRVALRVVYRDSYQHTYFIKFRGENKTQTLYQGLLHRFDKALARRVAMRQITIELIEQYCGQQYELFAESGDRIQQSLDTIRGRYGFESISRASGL